MDISTTLPAWLVADREIADQLCLLLASAETWNLNLARMRLEMWFQTCIIYKTYPIMETLNHDWNKLASVQLCSAERWPLATRDVVDLIVLPENYERITYEYERMLLNVSWKLMWVKSV